MLSAALRSHRSMSVSRETDLDARGSSAATVCPRQAAPVKSPGMAPARNNSARSQSACREMFSSSVADLAGAVLRLWGLPRLGLSHFDEGIYAIAGLWSVSPRGLAGLDPTLVPYAPPGFPILVGVAYLGLGVSDLAAILVSIVAGTLTIPAAAWLARRTFGAGAGAAAAALVAFSGFHVAFSRMALTDASFLLCWVLGLVCGQRFLERPGFSSAIALGLERGPGAVVQVQRLAARGVRRPGGVPGNPRGPERTPSTKNPGGLGVRPARRARCHRGLLALVCLRRIARGIRRVAAASPKLHGRLPLVAAPSATPARADGGTLGRTRLERDGIPGRGCLLRAGASCPGKAVRAIGASSCLRSSLSCSSSFPSSYWLLGAGLDPRRPRTGGARASGCWRRPGLACQS